MANTLTADMAWCGRFDRRDFRDRSLVPSIAVSLIAIAIIAYHAAALLRTTPVAAEPRGLARVQVEIPRAEVPSVVQPARSRPLPVHEGRTRRAALLVGLDNAPGGDPLPGSRADARTIREALVMYGFDRDDIVMLLESDATRSRVLGALDELAATSTDDSVTVVSFAAHSYRSGGSATMRMWDGRISPTEIAQRIGRIRGKVWTTFATCYAGSYQAAGTVGSNRIAVFSSKASEKSLQLGNAGSFTVLYMVRYAMIDGEANESVEAAFRYAREHIALASSRYVPYMDDGIKGDLVLGEPPDRPGDAEEEEEAVDAERTSRIEGPAASPQPSVPPRIVRIPQSAIRLGPSPVFVRPTSKPQSTRLVPAVGAGTERSSPGIIPIF